MKTYPSTNFSKVTPQSNAIDYISEAQSLKTIAASAGAQRYEFSLSTAWEKLPVARAIWMFLNARSQSQKFLIQIPLYDTPNGIVSGSVNTSNAYNIGETEIALGNYLPHIGDFIQFVGHSKVYGIEQVTGSNITIYPPLLKAVSNNESANVNNLKFTVRVKGALSKLESNKGNAGKISFKVIEAF